jgi:hypothetical protein
MAMVKGTSDNQPNSFMNTIIIMLVISFIDTIANYAKRISAMCWVKLEDYLSKKTKEIPLIQMASSSMSRVPKSTIKVKIDLNSKNPTSVAIIDILTHLPHTKSILFQNDMYSVNYNEEIEIAKGLYARLSGGEGAASASASASAAGAKKDDEGGDASTAVNGTTGQFGYVYVYSYTYDMEMLRNELNTIVKNYMIKMTNKLGNDIFYFSERQLIHYKDASGKIDTSKMPETLYFTMKKFVTNRSFKNLFGSNIDVIRRRVEFFRDNKDWYDNKGVPYTLGILVSGCPGSGKTSIIKCMANELKRHIVNIHLSDSMTKTQLENLFYSEQLHVAQTGKTETYLIPIDKRIYVLEDVDCQSQIVLDRQGTQSFEQQLIQKNKQLQDEVEQLNFSLNELAMGKKAVVMGNKAAPKPIEDTSNASNERITLSFLLNLLDGVLETPGRITFLTTNFVEKLDKAFTRPGRVDVISKFGYTTGQQMIEIVEHRYDTKLTEEQRAFILKLKECITPAEVGRILFENFDSLEGALQGLSQFAIIQTAILEEREKEWEKEKQMMENVIIDKKDNEDVKDENTFRAIMNKLEPISNNGNRWDIFEESKLNDSNIG